MNFGVVMLLMYSHNTRHTIIGFSCLGINNLCTKSPSTELEEPNFSGSSC